MAYEHGQWNVVCARCGFEYKARQPKLEWTGLRVCSGPGTCECLDPRHPQDAVKGKADRMNVPWTQSEPTPVFINSMAPITDDLGAAIYDDNEGLITT